MRVGLLVDITRENYKENIRHAKSLGFDFGQLVIWDMGFYTDEYAKELKAFLEEEKFEVISLWCGWTGPVIWGYPDMYRSLGLVPEYMRQKRMEDLEKGADFAYALGIDTVVTHIGYTPDNPYDPARIAIVHCLRGLCKKLQARGQRFAFETGEEIPLTLNILINEIGLDNVGVNFDPANLTSSGRGNANDAMDMLGCRIFGMHAKDAVPAKFGEKSGHQVLIGTGKVNFPRLMEQLKENGYEGDIVIEHEMSGTADRNREIIEAKQFLEDIIAKVF
ncbi:MAG: sugar phosphate isomerase/epimerase [Ruminococcaceae bacterium]|nr:sugar phosphate isomerase/epimerase [Oscillospiraceae bacterium]